MKGTAVAVAANPAPIRELIVSKRRLLLSSLSSIACSLPSEEENLSLKLA
jgi:hypothetical protein